MCRKATETYMHNRAVAHDTVDAATDPTPEPESKQPAPVAKPKFLSAVDERSLVWRWQKRNDYRARDALVRAFQPAIANAASKYQGRGLDLNDRTQLGNIGFLIALDKFDIHRRLRLWTYAKESERAEIAAAVEKSESIVYTPRQRGQKAKRSPADCSLNTPVQEGGAEDIDLLFDDYPDHELRHFSNQALNDALELLESRERTIFVARRLSDEPETLSTLAARFQISSERVRQIENKAFAIISTRMEEAETVPNPLVARQVTAEVFRGQGHKLSYSCFRRPDFRDRSPASNRERLR